jgi:hypothetical protein
MKKNRKPKSKKTGSAKKKKKTGVRKNSNKPVPGADQARLGLVSKSRPEKGGGDRQLRADQVVQIITDCIPRAGGNDNPIELENTLQFYGFDKDGVVVLAGFIIGNSDFGVPHYFFQLAKDALDWLAVGIKLIDLSKTIQDKAVPV